MDVSAGDQAVAGRRLGKPAAVPQALWDRVPEGDRERVLTLGARLLRKGFSPVEAVSAALDEIGPDAPDAAAVAPTQPPARPRGLSPLRARPPATPSAAATPRPSPPAPPVPSAAPRTAGRPILGRRPAASAPVPPPAPHAATDPLSRAVARFLGRGRESEAAEAARRIHAAVVSDPVYAVCDPLTLAMPAGRVERGLLEAVEEEIRVAGETEIARLRAARQRGEPDGLAFIDPEDPSTYRIDSCAP